MGLAAATANRTYVLRTKEEVSVPPPSVRVAVTLMEASKIGDSQSVRRVLAEWLPAPVLGDLLLLSPATRAGVLNRLMTFGAPQKEESKQRADPRMLARMKQEGKEVPDAKTEADWEQAISAYCACYGVDPMQVWLTLPFPVLLVFAVELVAERARAILDGTYASGLAQSGKSGKSALAKLEAQAGKKPTR